MRPLCFLFAITLLVPLLAAEDKSIAAARAQPYPPLPENVERRAVTIWSDGTKMAGDLYLPKALKPEDKLPAVVFIAGTGGTKKGSAARMGPMLVNSGYIFLAFDYRGWGESESKLLMLEPMPPPNDQGEVTEYRGGLSRRPGDRALWCLRREVQGSDGDGDRLVRQAPQGIEASEAGMTHRRSPRRSSPMIIGNFPS